jgi:hypothetical protein
MIEKSGFQRGSLPDPVVDVSGVQGNQMPECLFVGSCQKNEPGSREESGHRKVDFRNPETGMKLPGEVPVGNMAGEGFFVPKKGRPLPERPDSHVGPNASGKTHRMLQNLIFFASLSLKNGQRAGETAAVCGHFPDPGKQEGTGNRFLSTGKKKITGRTVRQQSAMECKNVGTNLDLSIVVKKPEDAGAMVVKEFPHRDSSRGGVEIRVCDNPLC